MQSIDLLEHGGGDFLVRHHGELLSLPDPRSMHYQKVLAVLDLAHVPGTPDDLSEWRRQLVFDRWCAAWDLPRFQEARRLAYLVDHYRSAISHDLAVYTPHDLGALWRARRWTLLLDILDRLPAHSQYAAAVSMDEDHAQMMAESLAARRESDDDATASGPSLTTWTPEVAMLTNILDAVRGVQHAVVAVQAGKNAPPAPDPAQRPVTPLEKAMRRVEYQRRKAVHENLVARLLPHKGDSGSPVH